MENFLNFCWILLSATALVAWARQSQQARSGRRRRLVALFCFLVLMFPVISATDDLHPVAQAMEDCSKRIHKTAVRCSAHLKLERGPSQVLFISAPVIVPATQTADWLQPVVAPSIQAGSMSFAPLRAPPASI
jgi:hypothetical protein